MSNFINLEGGIEVELIRFDKFDADIPASEVPSGPLVSMSDIVTTSLPNHYTVTVLAYLPSGKTFKKVDETKKNGVSLKEEIIYLNYYGATVVTTVDRNGNRDLSLCRDFRIEYNCEEGADEFDVYYLQFNYALDAGALSVDSILVREVNDDPETDRGTVTTPVTGAQ